MKKLYAIAMMARRYNDVHHGIETVIAAGVLVRTSEDEALGSAARLAKERWPSDDGWSNHSAAYCDISMTLVDEIADERKSDDS